MDSIAEKHVNYVAESMVPNCQKKSKKGRGAINVPPGSRVSAISRHLAPLKFGLYPPRSINNLEQNQWNVKKSTRIATSANLNPLRKEQQNIAALAG